MSMTVGIIGGGQLARMLALAGYPLGLKFKIYDPSPDACAGQVAPLTVGAFGDVAAMSDFAIGVDVITFDFENVPAASLRALSDCVRVAPRPEVLEIAQDRLFEKTAARALGIPCGEWWPVDDAKSLVSITADKPGNYVLKARRMGYDGKGQAKILQGQSMSSALALADSQACILEAFVPFDRELSIIVTRGRDGSVRSYPLTENYHVDGILHSSVAPASDCKALQSTAEAYIGAVVEHYDYVGTLAMELFQIDGKLLFNEMAPRVHNSGHWTIEGATCSQFENHLRAICGWPLGDTAARFVCRMENCIGEMPKLEALLARSAVHVHDYGKSARIGRKVGHVNFVKS